MNPLSDVIRPQTIDDVVGQKHLLCKGSSLYSVIKSGNIPNMIFYGPSGCGKTTVANIIAAKSNRKLCKLNATVASVSDIKAIIDNSNSFTAPNGILLYLDEIQYFTKRQQQSLLECIENGKVTLIASTTENPYFYIYNAVLSRCTVFEFKPVEPEDIVSAIKRAIKIVNEQKNANLELDSESMRIISTACGGDVRKAINSIELLAFISADGGKITHETVTECTQKSSMRYDRDGDMHYDILSAFQKSIRGSDENAALHYLAQLVEAGDIQSICRRLLVIASEDIGLAYPNAAVIVKSCVDNALMIGFPEARIPLAQAVILLSTAPKSNSVITAIDAALQDVKSGKGIEVPDMLRDSHYPDSKKLEHGIGYLYPHSFKNHYVRQEYMPFDLKDSRYYKYGDNKLERATQEYWSKIKNDSERKS